MPLSLVGTFGVMYLLGYSLNNLSLMALTISTGFVVDDAIVMIENIARYIEAGRVAAARRRSRAREQIGFTIVSLTVSLIAVLIPLLFMGDVVGRLFREFADHARRHHPGLGGGVADADADDVRAAPAPHAGGSSRAASIAPRSGSSTAIIDCYGAHAALGAARTRRATLLVAVADARRSPSCSTSSCRRASSRCRTPA